MLPGHGFDQQAFDFFLPDYNNFLSEGQQGLHDAETQARLTAYRARTHGENAPTTAPIPIAPEQSWWDIAR